MTNNIDLVFIVGHVTYPLFIFYLHHQHNSVECDHCHNCILKWRWHHKLPHPVLKAQLVLRHMACQRPGVYGKVYTSSLQTWEKYIYSILYSNLIKSSILSMLKKPLPHFFLNYIPPSSYLPAPERWWWSEPRKCWRRRRGRPRSTPRKRWTFPSGIPGLGPGSHKSHRLNVSAPCTPECVRLEIFENWKKKKSSC